MDARLSIVTLGVENLDRALAFYRDGLGWAVSSASQGDVAFFRAGGVVLALYPRRLLAHEANLPGIGRAPFGGITLAQNVPTPEAVDAALADAEAAGAKILRPAADAEWGGRSGYFADPDGHPWEVAWHPYFEFDADGQLVLPD
jgi:catechol 2,3-dioxygenase-like lactoylglutathione lyase family enzyme